MKKSPKKNRRRRGKGKMTSAQDDGSSKLGKSSFVTEPSSISHLSEVSFDTKSNGFEMSFVEIKRDSPLKK